MLSLTIIMDIVHCRYKNKMVVYLNMPFEFTKDFIMSNVDNGFIVIVGRSGLTNMNTHISK